MNEFKFLTAKEVAEMLKVSQAKAYEIVRKMNAEMEAMGYMTVRGRINAAYFYKKTNYHEREEVN